METPLIQLEQIVLGYERALLPPFALRIQAGEFWGIVGPNGAGKTTLIKTVLGLIKPRAGSLLFPAGRPRFGYVPQRADLNQAYPLTAIDIVLLGRCPGLGLGRQPTPVDWQRARAELARLGLTALEKRLYRSLSGGQQQRVLLARALAADPEVLILDEPTAGMDLPGETDILSFLGELHRQGKLTILMITHQLENVIRVADHLCLINKDANLFACGPVAGLLAPGRLSSAFNREIQVRTIEGEVYIQVKDRHHA